MNVMYDDAINPITIDTMQLNLSYSDYLNDRIAYKVKYTI